jgi:hypothetical protein
MLPYIVLKQLSRSDPRPERDVTFDVLSKRQMSDRDCFRPTLYLELELWATVSLKRVERCEALERLERLERASVFAGAYHVQVDVDHTPMQMFVSLNQRWRDRIKRLSRSDPRPAPIV